MTAQHTIAIVGAGIGGLAAAALLAQRGHDITVFDQFAKPAPVGSGLVIQPVGQAVLAEAGAHEAADAMGQHVYRMLGHVVPSGRRVLDVSYDVKHRTRHGLAIHRASLFDALLQAATRAGAKLVQSAHVQAAQNGHVTFKDGTTNGPFDLIIDSSGANSPLSPIKSYPLPYGAIWSTVDWPEHTDLPRDELRQCYRKADRMVGVLPIGKMPGETTQKAAIFWSLPQGGHAAWQDAGLDTWKDQATTLWPAFAPFAAQITDADQMTMARYTHGTLRKPYTDGIAYIGDAAHRASPQLGQGANMALLDAAALARAIDTVGPKDAPKLYAKARRLHVLTYQAMSAIFTPQYQSDSTWLPTLRDRALFPVSQIPPTPRILTAIVCGTMLPPLGRLTHATR